MTLQQRIARLTTNVVTRVPGAWRLFRWWTVKEFDRLAPVWNATRVSPDRLLAILAALEAIPAAPRKVLDLGTGTGAAARAAAELWADAEIAGLDLSAGMIEEARRLTTSERVRYQVGDSSALPFESASFDVVILNNMIPFFDELARVTRPGGHAAIAYSRGAETPIYVSPARLRDELGKRGFTDFRDFSAGAGVSLLAHRAEAS